jgi:hypothetical protein
MYGQDLIGDIHLGSYGIENTCTSRFAHGPGAAAVARNGRQEERYAYIRTDFMQQLAECTFVPRNRNPNSLIS